MTWLRRSPATAGQGLSDWALEDEICAHGARLAAGECHLVMLVAETDSRGTWYGPGLKSMAHWLNWRLGTSLHAAREQVRVGRALRSLPVLRAAFASGEVSYSKASALSRVATPATEEAFVYMARDTTASQLERIVRSYRRAGPDEGKEAMERYRYRRWSRSRTDDDGMVLVSARLAPEGGLHVGPGTLDYSGESFDLGLTIDVLLQAAGKLG